MGSIVIDVMLKSEILDPQGQAVRGALPRLGFSGFTDVRQGKRFVLTVEGDVTEEHLVAAREAAEKLLSNPVIEDVVSIRAEDGSVDAPAEARDEQGVREHTEEPAEGAEGAEPTEGGQPTETPDDGDADRQHTEEPAEGPDQADDDEGEQ